MGNRKGVFLALGSAMVSFFLAQAVWAQMGGGMGGHGGQMGGMGMGSGGAMGQGQAGPGGMDMGNKPQPGEMMHQGAMGSYSVRFHNMPMKMEGATNHLMVYIVGGDGKALLGAMAAYEITGPGGKVQKVMCSPMGNGYGGNVDFSVPGRYEVRLSTLLDKNQLSYFFEYTVK